MKRTIGILLLLCSILLAKPTGQFAGDWASDGGVASGKVSMSLKESGDSDLSFTYQGQTVKPKKVTAKVSDDQVDIICDVDLDAFHLRTTFHGTVEGKSISGKYQSTNADDGSALDSGTWKAIQQ